ncbi:hypothetical protein ES705_11031 [subsurface metagenome]
MVKEYEDPNKNPFIVGGEAAEKEQKKESEDPDKNPQIPGGKAAAEKEEQQAREKLESPQVNPFMPGAKPIDTEVSLEKQMAKHDALMVGGYVLVKEQPGKFSLISPDGQKAEVSLIEVEKFRDNPEDLKDLFSK